MAEQDWQLRARQRRRRVNLTIGTLFVLGALSGALVGYFEDDRLGLMAANSIPPWLALVSAAIFLVATTFGTWKLMRVSDEVERAHHASSTLVAGNILLIGYPTWFLLWKGGLVPSPDAMVLFLVGFAGSMLFYAWAHLWLKFR